jgi:hypothetical protein
MELFDVDEPSVELLEVVCGRRRSGEGSDFGRSEATRARTNETRGQV